LHFGWAGRSQANGQWRENGQWRLVTRSALSPSLLLLSSFFFSLFRSRALIAVDAVSNVNDDRKKEKGKTKGKRDVYN
jgi:hypothetical protein